MFLASWIKKCRYICQYWSYMANTPALKSEDLKMGTRLQKWTYWIVWSLQQFFKTLIFKTAEKLFENVFSFFEKRYHSHLRKGRELQIFCQNFLVRHYKEKLAEFSRDFSVFSSGVAKLYEEIIFSKTL